MINAQARKLAEPALAPSLGEAEIAAQAAAALAAGPSGRQAAARLLYRLGHRIRRYLERNGVPEAESEELLNEVILNFVTSKPTGRNELSPIKLLWTIIHHELIDWVRRRDALGRGKRPDGTSAEVHVADEIWAILMDTANPLFELAGWIKECVHRAAALLEHDKPLVASVLMFHVLGFSHRELAGVLDDISPADVSKPQEHAAKSRVHDYCAIARKYFEDCKE